MTQKLLKHELVERLLKLKEKQDELTVQMQCLSQEINVLSSTLYTERTKTAALDYDAISRSSLTRKSRLDVLWGDC